MPDLDAWVWWKKGDHLTEGAKLCAKFVAEVGQGAAADDVYVRRTPTPDGGTMTILVASDAWWHEQMRVHSNGWQGASFVQVVQRFDL